MLLKSWLLAGTVASLVWSAAAAAQEKPVFQSLEHGALVVWVVSPATAADRARQALRQRAASLAVKLPTTVQQQTSGSFGTASSNIGQTAGSYGQTAGSLGQTTGNLGQTAGNYGRAASELGRTASDVGQTAGSYGQTAASLGQPASTLGQTAGNYGQTSGANVGQQTGTNRDAIGVGTSPAVAASAPVNGDGRGHLSARNRMWNETAMELREEFIGLDVRVLDVLDNELRDRLVGAQGSEAYPDMVVGALPPWWDETGAGLTMLGRLREVSGEERGQVLGRIAILAKAPHPLAARAFAVWWNDAGMCHKCMRLADVEDTVRTPVQAAAAGLLRVLGGAEPGSDADAEAAQFSASDAVLAAWGPQSRLRLGGLKIRLDVASAEANDRLAVVGLRAIGDGERAFGVVHAVVVLRRNTAGRWKVLAISVNELARRWAGMAAELRQFARPGTVADVRGVSLASPADGDNRQPEPDLWWDNGGGAGLLVVESQRKLGAEWSAPRLDMVPDRDPRAKTRVTAAFALDGPYRWRVWAVGTGGVVVLSSWRSLLIQP